MIRRALLPALALLLLAGSLASASPAHRGERRSVQRQLRLLQTHNRFDHVAVRDVDNDGDLDILAAPHEGGIMLWRNAGHGRFRLAGSPHPSHRLERRGARFIRVHHTDDGSQWGVDRYDAAIPRGPTVAAVATIALVRASSFFSLRPVPETRSAGRAPPFA